LQYLLNIFSRKKKTFTSFSSIDSMKFIALLPLLSYSFTATYPSFRIPAYLNALPKVFIDGEAGTTGLQVRERLSKRDDLEVISPPPDLRKDPVTRKKYLNDADAAILCLPDSASIEAAEWLKGELGCEGGGGEGSCTMTTDGGKRWCRHILSTAISRILAHISAHTHSHTNDTFIHSLADNDSTVLIDASTAFRTNPSWTYGFPELSPQQRIEVQSSKRISNPGCYPTGFISLVRPLVEAGIIEIGTGLTVNAISGYSGGGKQLMSLYETDESCEPWGSYGFDLNHKHLPEMALYSGLSKKPIFQPAVGNFPQGMVVSVPLHYDMLKGNTGKECWNALKVYYAESKMISVQEMNGKGEAGLFTQVEEWVV